MATKEVMTTLNSGVVVDRSVLISLSSSALQNVFLGVVASGKNFVVVDNYHSFFNSDSMLKLIESGSDDYKMIAEKFNISVSDAEVAAIQRAVELRKEITEKAKPPIPPYEFAIVPTDWSVDTNIRATGQSVRRITNGRPAGHSIGLKTLQNVWLLASERWGKNNPKRTMSVTADGYTRTAEVLPDRVVIGCQVVQRYELEQFAKSKDWPFPKS